jgi:pimeloyl-ACP methyl ester carboxylesterase
MQVRIGNTIINYQVVGDPAKPCLVLVHGWLDSLHTFDHLVALLQADYYLVALDWPGFGQSTMPPETADVAWYADCLRQFTQTLSLQPVAYIGHSFGVRVLLYLAGTTPTTILAQTKLICIGGAGITLHSFKKTVLRVVAKPFKLIGYLVPTHMYTKLRAMCYRLIGSDYAASTHLGAVYQAVINYDLRTVASHITIPTLLIYGEHDTSTPVAYGQQFAALIKQSQLTVITNADHFVHQTHAAEVARHTREYLARYA